MLQMMFYYIFFLHKIFFSKVIKKCHKNNNLI